MKKILLRNYQSPGDVVMLTAAVRDLHRVHPGKFVTDVRTACQALWENNPYITPLREDDPQVTKIECEYPLIHKSNDHPVHFINGFIEDLSRQLNVPFAPTAFKGDIHISELEKSWMSQVHELTGQDLPFWIIVAGGKSDFTVKWWDTSRWQQVVNHFAERILFVQVGEAHHYHPPLDRVLDLRGKTNLRQLVRLVYHAQGVLCPITLLMHLAAAVEVKGGCPKNRPCVVIAGGREPMQWEAYPHHQFIHTNGALLCCDQGGCWKSRTVPIGDGDTKDEELCVDVVTIRDDQGGPRALPHCMDLITANEVIRRIQMHFDGGVTQFLTPEQTRHANRAVEKNSKVGMGTSIPGRQSKTSVVFVTVTDARFFPGTVATVNSILCFHPETRVCVINNNVDKPGLSPSQRKVFQERGVDVTDAKTFAKRGRKLGAWELKAYAAAELTQTDDVLVGVDSDCILCSPIDDVLAGACVSGCFYGGRDAPTDYDESYEVYGIAAPTRNDRYMSASLYICALTPQNRALLHKWADFCARAGFGDKNALPGHGDQGVLNAILFAERGAEGVRLLDNRLWSQHWCYWDDTMRIALGQIYNQSAGEMQRALHCGGTEKFWWREHFYKVNETGRCITNYAWFLALLWFGDCRLDEEDLSLAHRHLREALVRFRKGVVELVPRVRAGKIAECSVVDETKC